MPSNRVQPWLPCKTDSPCSEEPTRLQVYPCSYHAHQRAAHKRSAAQGAALFQFEQSARQQLANEAPRILGGLEARARHKIAAQVAASQAMANEGRQPLGIRMSSSTACQMRTQHAQTSPAMESPNTECSSGATSSTVSASAAAHVTTASNPPPDVCRTPLAGAEARHSSARGRIARPQEQQQQQRQAHTMSVTPSHTSNTSWCACNSSTLGQKADSSSRGCPAGHSSAGRFASSNSRAAQDGWSWYRGPGPPGETLQEPLLLWNTEASSQPAARCAPALGQDSVKGRQLHDAGLEKQQDAQLFDGPLTGQCLSPLSCTGRTAAELSEPRRQTSADWPQADVSRSELPQLGSNCRNSRSPDWGKRHSKSGRSSSKSRTSPVAQVLSSCHAAAVLALDKSSCNARAESLREPLLLDQS